MERERWQQIKGIVGDALELEDEARRALVDSACQGDPELHEEVLSLLEASKGDALGSSAADEALRLLATTAHVDRIGPFDIDRELGQGGMGTVYLAHRSDGEITVPVALKIVRASIAGSDMLERFRLEREVLAGLSHPYVALILDGGSTSDGVPYFAMEYVEGTRIDAHCDEHRLSVDERVSLFVKVCEGVQHAHQNLIVHRDLKPSNILVTAEGTPKLLDFGIAKLLKEEPGSGDPTLTALQALTPDYASPEQVLGGRVTTASDVYSLGVLLYELLTGRKPLQIKGRTPSEAIDAMRTEQPELPRLAVDRRGLEDAGEEPILTADEVAGRRGTTPGELRRRLSGDLANVVLKALRKEPTERYPSVQAFAADLEREGAGLPVTAKSDTLAYRLGTFVRRNKLGVAAASLLLLSLVGGIAGTFWQARVAQNQRDLAQRRFSEIRELAKTVMFELHDAIVPLSGSTPARELLVGRAVEYLDRLTQEVGDDPDLLSELGAGYARIGEIQGAVFASNLGQPQLARASFESSLDLRRRRLDLQPDHPQALVDLAESLVWLGEHELGWAGDTSRSLQYFDEAQRILAGVSETELDVRGLTSVLKLNGSLTFVLVSAGMPQRAVTVQQHSLTVINALEAGGLEEAGVLRRSIYALTQLSTALAEAGDLEGAVRYSRDAVDAADRAGMLTTGSEIEMLQAVARRDLGALLAATGQLTEATSTLGDAVERLEDIVSSEPGNAQSLENLGLALDRLGLARTLSGDPEAGLALYRRVLGMAEAYLAQIGASADIERYRVGGTQRVGEALALLMETEGALASYRSSIEHGERLVVSDPGHALTRRDLAVSYLKLARLLSPASCSEASEAWSRGLGLWREVEALGLRVASGYQDPAPLLSEPRCAP